MTENNIQQDTIERFSDALIQHGPLSNRIYLMKLKDAAPTQLIPAMNELAEERGYTKIFAKVPANRTKLFLEAGYQPEAHVPGFYHSQEAAVFLGRYLDRQRRKERWEDEIKQVIDLAHKKQEQPINSSLPAGATLRRCRLDDAVRMSRLYKTVFPSYPFPIDDPQYINDTMLDDIVYFGIEINKKLISLSSAEMDIKSKNVEMTDFATLPKHRGHSYSGLLLAAMEKQMRRRGIQTTYTIARAVSPGMNITFAKAGYKYGGRLINNTCISGQIESMNVWYKALID